MRVEKLFKKIEKYFNKSKEKQLENLDKKKKLKITLDEKIKSKKNKIKNCNNRDKKIELKEELSVLKKFKEKL